MAENANEITVAQSATVRFGPVLDDSVIGDLSTIDLDEYPAVGYTTEDGITFSASAEVTDIMAHQSATPVRRIVTSRGATASFSLEQWNADNFAVAFGGGEWSEPTPGTYRYDPPADTDALAEYGLVLELADGDKESNIYVFRCNVDGAVETTLTRTGASLLPITVTALTPDGQDRPWALESNDPAFAASS